MDIIRPGDRKIRHPQEDTREGKSRNVFAHQKSGPPHPPTECPLPYSFYPRDRIIYLQATVRQVNLTLRTACPDLPVVPEKVDAYTGGAVIRWRASGTNTGPDDQPFAISRYLIASTSLS
jgi:hypothetical protein